MLENKSRAIVYKVHSELIELSLVSSEIQGVFGINTYAGAGNGREKNEGSLLRSVNNEDFQRRNKPN